MPSPILARANALMHRHRSNPDDGDEIPILTDAVASSEEIPLLTDAQPPASHPELPPLTAPDLSLEPLDLLPATTSPIAPLADADSALLQQLCERVEARLVAALPELIRDCLQEVLQERTAASQDEAPRDLLAP